MPLFYCSLFRFSDILVHLLLSLILKLTEHSELSSTVHRKIELQWLSTHTDGDVPFFNLSLISGSLDSCIFPWTVYLNQAIQGNAAVKSMPLHNVLCGNVEQLLSVVYRCIGTKFCLIIYPQHEIKKNKTWKNGFSPDILNRSTELVCLSSSS